LEAPVKKEVRQNTSGPTKEFKVMYVTVSRDSLAHRGQILIALDGEGYEARFVRSKPDEPQLGQLLQVPLKEGHPDFEALGYAGAIRLASFDPERVKEVWEKQRFTNSEWQAVMVSQITLYMASVNGDLEPAGQETPDREQEPDQDHDPEITRQSRSNPLIHSPGTNTKEEAFVQKNPFRAAMIAEGAIEAKSEEEYFQAWQTLVDTGLAWKLQGFFGRTARDMIHAGVIQPPPNHKQTKEGAISKKNYENLMELLGGQDYRRIEVQGYMPLVVERLKGLPIISLTHYGTQNGDPMRDPECCFLIDAETAQPIYFRNDYAGIEHATAPGHFGEVPVKPDLQKHLQSFVSIWWGNLREQGFFERARELLEQDKSHEHERNR
jgi:hypothetical protein